MVKFSLLFLLSVLMYSCNDQTPNTPPPKKAAVVVQDSLLIVEPDTTK